MKTSISVGGAYYNGEDWEELVAFTLEAERLGVDHVWTAEAWGMDAIVPLAYLAAKTEKIHLGTGIVQISSRVPSMIAMTSQSMATVSNNRFILGLGVSGPQVVEGLHGASFAHPLGRLRECLEVVRLGLSGERVLAGVRCLFGEGDVMESQSVSPLSRFRTLLRSLGGDRKSVV